MKLAGRLRGEQRDAARGRVDALLQRPEVQAAVAGDHDLAVDHGARREVAPDGLHHLGEVAGHRPLLAAADLDLVAVAEHDRAEAVPLGLVELAGRDRGRGLGQHRRDGRHHGELHVRGLAGRRVDHGPMLARRGSPAGASTSARSWLLVLTFSTGLVDAVSYLGLGRVFTANMTGNIVLLGFGIAGSGGLPVVAPLVSLVAFLAGWPRRRAGGENRDRHAQHVARALWIEIGLVLAAAIMAAAADVRPSSFSGDAVIALLASGDGRSQRHRQAARRARPDDHRADHDVTGPLAADSRLAGGTGKGSMRRIAAVLAMFLGAVAGAPSQISLVAAAAGRTSVFPVWRG